MWAPRNAWATWNGTWEPTDRFCGPQGGVTLRKPNGKGMILSKHNLYLLAKT